MIQAQLAKNALRITATYQGQERQRNFYRSAVTLGRAGLTDHADFDLSPDNTISRRHARIWIEGGTCWIEDLGSKFGTKIEGQDIREKGKVPLVAGCEVQVGETALKVERLFESASGFAELLPQPTSASTLEIDQVINSSSRRLALPDSSSLEAMQKQGLLLEILIQFSLPAPLDQLLQTIIGRVVELIPGAARGSLLLCHPATDGLLLTAFVADGEPAVSETLARRALKQHQAFVWRNKYGSDFSRSIVRHQIQSGMYAPLIYDHRALGVLCVDNADCHSAFSDQDLQLLVAVADHAAVAVSHHQSREELNEKSKLLELALAHLTPSVRERLIEEARSAFKAP